MKSDKNPKKKFEDFFWTVICMQIEDQRQIV